MFEGAATYWAAKSFNIVPNFVKQASEILFLLKKFTCARKYRISTVFNIFKVLIEVLRFYLEMFGGYM